MIRVLDERARQNWRHWKNQDNHHDLGQLSTCNYTNPGLARLALRKHDLPGRLVMPRHRH